MQDWQWKGRRRRTRFRRHRWKRLALIAVSAVLIVFGLAKLIGYGMNWLSSRRTAETLRQAYQEESAPSVPPETAAPAASPVPSAPAQTAARATPAPTVSPVPRLALVPYPENPKLRISSRFKTLRNKNADIVGWLTIDDLLDEAVVQRDETYYMNHDALGKKNVNGAIFLDSSISLRTRPYSLILYGHNMKTGAMFGKLRNYENAAFYHKNPFISFDSLYERGRYVVFAVGSISTEQYDAGYLDFFALTSANAQERQAAINTLKAISVYSCTIDVQPDDQLLLLVTCVDNDDERRVVAARRVRDGENEKELKKVVERSRKW